MKMQFVDFEGGNKIFVIYFREINFRHQSLKHRDMKAYKKVKFWLHAFTSTLDEYLKENKILVPIGNVGRVA